MSDLERRREARDLWISRGHIFSAGVGVSLLLVGAFAVGYRMGAAEQDGHVAEPSLEVVESDRQLQELLERLDALKDPTGVDALTFPDLKKGLDAEHVAAPAPSEDAPSVTISMSDHAVPNDLLGRLGPPPPGLHVEWVRSSDVDLIRRSVAGLEAAGVDPQLVVEKEIDDLVYALVSTHCRSEKACTEWKREHNELVRGFQEFAIRRSRVGND